MKARIDLIDAGFLLRVGDAASRCDRPSAPAPTDPAGQSGVGARSSSHRPTHDPSRAQNNGRRSNVGRGSVASRGWRSDHAAFWRSWLVIITS